MADNIVTSSDEYLSEDLSRLDQMGLLALAIAPIVLSLWWHLSQVALT
ncbi:hypothetical protein [Rhodococcus spongiicola]|nr:hypothetical protein [Rhodococcus spongiicola]